MDGVCVNFLDRLTLEDVSNGMRICVKRSSVRWSTNSRCYWNNYAKIGIMGVFGIGAHIVC